MLWANGGGGSSYPGVVSGGAGILNVLDTLLTPNILIHSGGVVQLPAIGGGDLLFLGQGQENSGLVLKNGVGLFGATPPAAPTTGGAHTAGGTYTAVEQAMLEACYTALQSIGLVT